jgi:alanine dehydrogenase
VKVLCAGKVITDEHRQCATQGNLRAAIKARRMNVEDIYADLGDIVNGTKRGREGGELIVCDFSGVASADAAVGEAAHTLIASLE